MGRGRKKTSWKVLIIDRMEPSELNISEDPTTYTAEECSDLLKTLHQGNRSMGGLKLVTIGYGIVGKISGLRFYKVSYLTVLCFLLSSQCFLILFWVILGFIRFLEPYYMLIITERKNIGSMLGAKVYGISKSRMVIIPNPVVRTKKAYCNTEKRWVVALFLSSIGPICNSLFLYH